MLEVVKEVKNGRRLYGRLFNANGVLCYVAVRRHDEMFRAGRASLSEALRDGVASWAIDHDTLMDMKLLGVSFVGVRVRETNDLYLTRMEFFFDPALSKVMNYSRSGGALQRYLPVRCFRLKGTSFKL